jgi:hypothetical protein
MIDETFQDNAIDPPATWKKSLRFIRYSSLCGEIPLIPSEPPELHTIQLPLHNVHAEVPIVGITANESMGPSILIDIGGDFRSGAVRAGVMLFSHRPVGSTTSRTIFT